jgi:8-oxo-dGTP diphosphatase
MIRVPAVAIIIENERSEILLLLRDDKPSISYPNHWTLVGGRVEEDETPEMAAHREMLEEIGVDGVLRFWKRYDRQHPKVVVDQYIYTARLDVPCELLTLGEGQDLQFFNSLGIKDLKIGFEFGSLLNEYFLNRTPD